MLFLDEPSSGLDAFAAQSLIENIARIVKDRQIACLMTIHQPSWAMFTRVDRVILLAKGAVYYDGPPRGTIPWFQKLPYEVPEGVNPADHFISIAEKDAEILLSSWKSEPPKVEAQPATYEAHRYPGNIGMEFVILLTR